jgi:thymidylate kinase
MLFIAHSLLESRDLLADEEVDLVLADGYWYKYLCSVRLHGLPEAWLMKTVSCLPVPRLTILFDLAPERSWARKPDVTPYECGMAEPGESSFVDFQTRLRTVLVALGTGRSWPVVDAGRTQDGVAAELWDLVRERV